MIGSGLSQNVALRRIADVNLYLSKKPWSGLLWESINKRMITRKENKAVAVKLLYYMAKGDFSKINYDKDRLIKDYASAINWEGEIDQLPLPPRIGEQA